MELLNEIITNWYPVLWLASGGVALAVWVWASKRKVRMDIDQAAKMILEGRYRNEQMSKKSLKGKQNMKRPGRAR